MRMLYYYNIRYCRINLKLGIVPSRGTCDHMIRAVKQMVMFVLAVSCYIFTIIRGNINLFRSNKVFFWKESSFKYYNKIINLWRRQFRGWSHIIII